MLKIRGNKVLNGVIEVKGSKNAALALIVCSILTKGKITLENVPNILDVNILLNILKYLNVKIEFNNNLLNIDSTEITYKSLIIDDCNKIRASSYLMGAFLSLFNKVEITNPGGCNFSERPIDFHLEGFKTFGAEVREDNNFLFIESNNVKNGYYYIPNVSVGTTIDLLLFFSLKECTFILDNVALECEVEEVIKFLTLVGVEIKRIKEKTLLIKGKKCLIDNIKYKVMNDRIEAGSFAILGACIGDDLKIKGFNMYDNLYLLNIFLKLKIPFKLEDDILTISRFTDFEGIKLNTNPYPLFPTDLQPLMCVLLSLGKSESLIEENIYPKRMSHLNELNKLVFNLSFNNNIIIVNNIKKLNKNRVVGYDLRGSFSLLIALLLIDDFSYLDGVKYLDRGYENLVVRLKEIGALIYEEKNNIN